MRQPPIFRATMLVVMILSVCTLSACQTDNATPASQPAAQSTNPTQSSPEADPYLLSDYPTDIVPLYQLKLISAMKFFVNHDPTRVADYFDQKVNYYNVVFESDATPQDMLAYYRSLMSEQYDPIDPEYLFARYDTQTTAEGMIGKYKISISHYGDRYAYLQVYLPTDQYSDDNRYYEDYPEVVAIDPSWSEYENSYGKLNQNKGEIEYTRYFVINQSLLTAEQQSNPMNWFYNNFAQQYADRTDFTTNAATGEVKWSDGANRVTLTFSAAHGRIYLMIRHPMN